MTNVYKYIHNQMFFHLVRGNRDEYFEVMPYNERVKCISFKKLRNGISVRINEIKLLSFIQNQGHLLEYHGLHNPKNNKTDVDGHKLATFMKVTTLNQYREAEKRAIIMLTNNRLPKNNNQICNPCIIT